HELPAGDGSPDIPPAAAGRPPSPPTELEKLQAERDSLFDRLARLQAEFENYRKRAAKEQQDFRDYAVTDALKSFLPVLDSLDRALDASSKDASADSLRSGVELVRKQMSDALSRLGVTAIAAVGSEFDPQVHEAVEVVDTNEVPDHHVISELQ